MQAAPMSASSNILDLQETRESLDAEEKVHRAVNKLGGIKKAKPEEVLDELMQYENLNLLDVYKHMQMMEKSKHLEGNKQIRIKESTSKKESRKKQLGELYQESRLSGAKRSTLREDFIAKLSNMALTTDEFESYIEAEEKMWLFCTLFPQHCEFEKGTLIQLWIAAGFLKGKHEDHIGDLYFQTLVSNGYINRSIQFSDEDRYKVNSNKMNEEANMSQKKHYITLKKIEDHYEAYKAVQYMSLVGDDIDEISLKRLIEFKDLKAVMMFNEGVSGINKIPQNVFSVLKQLKVLDLSRTNIIELPNSIAELIELRYLDLSHSQIELLPETLDSLLRLRTLKLKDCRRFFKLPERMRKLTSLKHLELDILRQLAFMPKGIGALTKLETLSAFLVQKDEGRSIMELNKMNNLKGSLCISNLENVSGISEVKKAELYKKCLKEIELRWSEFHQPCNKWYEDEILQELLPNFSLEKLQISCYAGFTFPRWIGIPSFNMLTSITLFKCHNCKRLPSLGKQPSLKILSLIQLESVEIIGAAFRGDITDAFPMLERLTIVGLVQLECWEGVKGGDYPRLNKLIIERCPKLVEIPSLIQKLCNLKHMELIKCSALSTLHENTLSISLTTLIIEECPLIVDWLRKLKRRNRYNILKYVTNVWVDKEPIFEN